MPPVEVHDEGVDFISQKVPTDVCVFPNMVLVCSIALPCHQFLKYYMHKKRFLLLGMGVTVVIGDGLRTLPVSVER